MPHTRPFVLRALTVQVYMYVVLEREILWIVLKAPCVGRAHWLVYIDCMSMAAHQEHCAADVLANTMSFTAPSRCGAPGISISPIKPVTTLTKVHTPTNLCTKLYRHSTSGFKLIMSTFQVRLEKIWCFFVVCSTHYWMYIAFTYKHGGAHIFRQFNFFKYLFWVVILV